jgi:hypothetical protein
LSYINGKIKETENDSNEFFYEKGLIKLLTDYLLSKEIISTNSNDLFDSIKNNKDDDDDENLDESLIKLTKSKDVFKFFRIFQDRQYFNTEFKLHLVKYIKSELINENNCESIINILIVTPFLLNNNEKFDDKYQIIELFENKLKNILEKNDLLNETNHFIISLLIWSLLVMQKRSNLNLKVDSYIEKLASLLNDLSENKNEIQKNKCLIHVLRAFDYLFGYKYSVDKSFIENNEKITSIVGALKLQLSSPYHESRLISLNILTKLLNPGEVKSKTSDDEDGNENETVLTMLIKAENIKSTIEDYRQKMYYMQCLEYDSSQKLIPSSEYEDVYCFFMFVQLNLKYFFYCRSQLDIFLVHYLRIFS